jgi:hypothetical protein
MGLRAGSRQGARCPRALRLVFEGIYAGDDQSVFDNLAQPSPKIISPLASTTDLSHTSLEFDPNFSIRTR